MSFNPYESPGAASGPQASGRVSGPAICLIVIAGISIAFLGLSLAFDVFVLATGAVDQWQQPNGMTKRTQVTIRAVWGTLILLSNIGTLYGAVHMLRLQNRGAARFACILACIPCFSPCLILGIPFGIWGLSVLGDRQVQREFKS